MFVYIGDVTDPSTISDWLDLRRHSSEFITHPNSQEENSHIKDYSFHVISIVSPPVYSCHHNFIHFSRGRTIIIQQLKELFLPQMLKIILDTKVLKMTAELRKISYTYIVTFMFNFDGISRTVTGWPY